MTLRRFQAITGHCADYGTEAGLITAWTECDCMGQHTPLEARAKDLRSALRALHHAVYLCHCHLVFRQQKWRCARCGKRTGLDPHHRIRRSKQRLDTVANLQGLCRACHDRVTNLVRPADRKDPDAIRCV